MAEWEWGEKQVIHMVLAKGVLEPTWDFVPLGNRLRFDLTFLIERATKWKLIDWDMPKLKYFWFTKPYLDLAPVLVMLNRGTFTGSSLHTFADKESGARVPKMFFFQAEDGIRDADVTGVQTCALPISGRYGPREDAAARPYYWANHVDAWNGTTNRDNTLARWAVHLQNDFRARLDWCVKPFNEANHPPHVVLNGVRGIEVLRLRTKAGTKLKLDAGATSDPDGQRLRFEWFHYPEPGTYRGQVQIEGAGSAVATVHVPDDAARQKLPCKHCCDRCREPAAHAVSSRSD